MDETAPQKPPPSRLFDIAVLLKGAHGVAELCAAFAIYIVSGTTLYNILTSILRIELTEDPNDFIANFLLDHTHITTAGKDFAALYLLVAATVNIAMAVGLLRGRKHMFPIAISILGIFVVYQLIVFMHSHSLMLIVLSLYDVFLMWIIFRQYRLLWPKNIQKE